MNYRTCHEAYRHGVNSRIAYPLSHGLYKLIESKERIQRSGDEVMRISGVVNKTMGRYELTQCTYQDKALLLRGVPLDIARRIGYEIVPGLRALVSDGVPSVQSESAARHIEAAIDNYLAQWEALRKTYYKNIPHEYMLMRSGRSNAMEVVNSALQLIDGAVSLLPPVTRQQL
jgi:hypothetical protein